MKRVFVFFFSLTAALLMLSPVSYAGDLDTWYDDIEVEILGHSFDEEYWTAEIQNTTENGDLVKFTVSYVNQSNVQAFLVAMHSVTNTENGTGTLPYQLFGMHFITDSGEEVFISALFAFLLAYNDTNNNSIPDPENEKLFHVIPFGARKDLNDTYPLKVTNIDVEKISDTHYRFGMKYENLYALVTENYVASHIYKTGWIAKFTELQIVYDITFNEDTGEVTAETFYNIGEVTELWGVLLGIPIKADPNDIPDNFGLAAAHYVTVFTSKFDVKGSDSGHTIATNVTKPIDEDITIEVRKERAFEIGFRGDYTLYDGLGQVQKESSPAINILLQARPMDLSLVLWQLGFSANIFSFMAYSLSDYVQDLYKSPQDLKDKSLNPFNKYGFRASALWYVVCFPEWNGHRIEHDPVYTAYASTEPVDKEGEEPPDDGGDDSKEEDKLCGSIFVVGSMMTAVPAIVVIRRKINT